MGHSMGGAGAIYLGSKYPKMFAAVAAEAHVRVLKQPLPMQRARRCLRTRARAVLTGAVATVEFQCRVCAFYVSALFAATPGERQHLVVRRLASLFDLELPEYGHVRLRQGCEIRLPVVASSSASSPPALDAAPIRVTAPRHAR
jgi:hypothetical protein